MPEEKKCPGALAGATEVNKVQASDNADQFPTAGQALEWLRAIAVDTRLTSSTAKIAAALVDRIMKGDPSPSFIALGADVGASHDSAERATRALERHGYLHITRRRGRGRTCTFLMQPQEGV